MPQVPWPPPKPLKPGMRFRVVIAVDPGDAHVGQAMTSTQGAVTAWEEDAEGAVERLEGRIESLRRGGYNIVLVIEEFSLYEDKAPAQVGSRMLTARMIGAMEHVAKRNRVKVVYQPASCKKATRAQLRARGIKSVAKGPHATDAETHLYHRLLRYGFDE